MPMCIVWVRANNLEFDCDNNITIELQSQVLANAYFSKQKLKKKPVRLYQLF